MLGFLPYFFFISFFFTFHFLSPPCTFSESSWIFPSVSRRIFLIWAFDLGPFPCASPPISVVRTLSAFLGFPSPGFPYLGIRPRLLSFYFRVRYRMAMFEPITVRSNVRIFFLLLSLIVLQLFLFHALTSTFDADESPSIVGDVSSSEYPTKYYKKYETQLFFRRAMDRDRYRECKDAGRACK